MLGIESGHVYMACIRSCLLYGCKKWTTRTELEPKDGDENYQVNNIYVVFSWEKNNNGALGCKEDKL